MIGHKYGKQLWLIGAIYNANKDFRIECVFQTDSNTVENFIKKYIPLGNTKITDGFSSYNFLDQFGSGCNHNKHLHGGGDFGLGL